MQHRTRWTGGVSLALALLAGLLGGLMPGGAVAKPQRLVSINLCTDQLLMLLADRSHILSISYLGADPAGSALADRAAGIPLNRGTAEEALALRPDLVLSGLNRQHTTNRLIEALGVPVFTLPPAASLDDALDQIRALGDAIGEPERASALAGDIAARLAALPPSADDSRRPGALVLQPNGYTTGRHTLANDILVAAGYRNLAAEHSIAAWGTLSLEAVILSRPDVLVLDDQRIRRQSLAQNLLAHPALEGRQTTIELPTHLWTCPGPALAEAAERLATARVAGR